VTWAFLEEEMGEVKKREGQEIERGMSNMLPELRSLKIYIIKTPFSIQGVCLEMG
jgi:hypothetical protein